MVATPSVALTKSCSPAGPYFVGQVITYEFTVMNNGDDDLDNVVVTDNVLGAIGNIPSLAAGQMQTLTQTYTVVAGDAGNTLNNIGSVTATGNTSGTAVSDTSNHSAVINPAPTITLVKSCTPAGPYDNGDTITYSFAVTNNSACLLYTSPSPRDATLSRMPSSA